MIAADATGYRHRETTPIERPTMSDKNVVELLTSQHHRIRDMFAQVREAGPDDKQRLFDDLRKLLAVHETAEEMVVHPAARLHGASAVVDDRLAEEHDAKQVLETLDGMSVDDPQFGQRLAMLERMVLEHAENEEKEEFPLLLEGASTPELRVMSAAVLAAEAIAPTHPHPGVESAVANTAVGPIASVVDRTRDVVGAVLGKSKDQPDPSA